MLMLMMVLHVGHDSPRAVLVLVQHLTVVYGCRGSHELLVIVVVHVVVAVVVNEISVVARHRVRVVVGRGERGFRDRIVRFGSIQILEARHFLVLFGYLRLILRLARHRVSRAAVAAKTARIASANELFVAVQFSLRLGRIAASRFEAAATATIAAAVNEQEQEEAEEKEAEHAADDDAGDSARRQDGVFRVADHFDVVDEAAYVGVLVGVRVEVEGVARVFAGQLTINVFNAQHARLVWRTKCAVKVLDELVRTALGHDATQIAIVEAPPYVGWRQAVLLTVEVSGGARLHRDLKRIRYGRAQKDVRVERRVVEVNYGRVLDARQNVETRGPVHRFQHRSIRIYLQNGRIRVVAVYLAQKVVLEPHVGRVAADQIAFEAQIAQIGRVDERILVDILDSIADQVQVGQAGKFRQYGVVVEVERLNVAVGDVQRLEARRHTTSAVAGRIVQIGQIFVVAHAQRVERAQTRLTQSGYLGEPVVVQYKLSDAVDAAVDHLQVVGELVYVVAAEIEQSQRVVLVYLSVGQIEAKIVVLEQEIGDEVHVKREDGPVLGQIKRATILEHVSRRVVVFGTNATVVHVNPGRMNDALLLDRLLDEHQRDQENQSQ